MTRGRFIRPEIELTGVDEGRVLYSLICQVCGGFETTLKGDGSAMSMVHCGACGAWLGRLSALNFHAAVKARDAGLPVDRRDYLPGGRFAQDVPVARGAAARLNAGPRVPVAAVGKAALVKHLRPR